VIWCFLQNESSRVYFCQLKKLGQKKKYFKAAFIGKAYVDFTS